MDTILKRISQLGDQLVRCDICCEGINNNPGKGIIPRGLNIELNGSEKENGCIVVSINPDRSSESERQFYLEKELKYQSANEYWRKYGSKNEYFQDVRSFLKCAGYSGPILWNVVVKCENDVDHHWPSLQTVRQCAHGFLSRELESVPEYWPIIAIGRETHRALSYLYPFKSILGVPHPISEVFNKLFVNNSRTEFQTCIQEVIDDFKQKPGVTSWLACQ